MLFRVCAALKTQLGCTGCSLTAVQSANPSHRDEGGAVGILMPFWSLFHLLSVSFLTSDGLTFTLPDFAGSVWILLLPHHPSSHPSYGDRAALMPGVWWLPCVSAILQLCSCLSIFSEQLQSSLHLSPQPRAWHVESSR